MNSVSTSPAGRQTGMVQENRPTDAGIPPAGAAQVPATTGRRHVHIPALDGLRGIAILLVLLFHFGVSAHNKGTVIWTALHLAGAGWVGVDLFFVLSGFLITSILLEAKRTDGYFRNFYMRRVLRIFPLYYAVLLLCIVLAPSLVRDPYGRVYPVFNAWALWLYLSNYFPPRDTGLIQFWSLAVEEQFYLVWPTVVFLVGMRGLKGVCYTMLVAALAFRITRVVIGLSLPEAHHQLDYWTELTYFATYCRMDTLAAGALLALAAHGSGGIARIIPLMKMLTPLAAIGLVTIYVLNHGSFWFGNPLVQTAGHTLLAVFFSGMLVWAVVTPAGSIGGRFFGSAVLRFFGKYSYGIYVIHGVVHPWLDTWKWTSVLAGEGTGALLVLEAKRFTVGAGVSVGTAMLSWHLFEKHFLKLKRFFEYRTVTLARPVTSASDASAAKFSNADIAAQAKATEVTGK